MKKNRHERRAKLPRAPNALQTHTAAQMATRPRGANALEWAMATAFAEAEANGLVAKAAAEEAAAPPDPVAEAQKEALKVKHLWEFRGYGIAISPDEPRYTPSPEFAGVVDEAWSREVCGVTNKVADGQVIHLERARTFIMNPRTLAIVRERAAAGGEPLTCLHAEGWDSFEHVTVCRTCGTTF
jgi:hypothetical protein